MRRPSAVAVSEVVIGSVPRLRWAALVVAALLVAGCGGDATPLPAAGTAAQDLNPRDPATLRAGGDLRLPLSALPENFNTLHVDGGVATTRQVMWALMPRVFNDGADGRPELDPQYMESARLTGTDPQVVTYRIREQARWDDGTPITWADFAAQAAALRGDDPALQALDLAGYERIASVQRGATDREVRVSFTGPTPEWQGLFSPLYPASTTSDPETFNSGWRDAPGTTAGPFRVAEVDGVAGTVVLERNPSWWGTAPRLDRVIFVVTDPAAILDQLANGELDATPLGSANGLARARAMPGVDVRRAPERSWQHVTFNGAPGRLLADLRLRRAVAQGIDRVELARRIAGDLVEDPALMGHHILPVGSTGYQDNSDVLPFDPAAAAAELDAMGWSPGPQGVRERDGRPLRLSFVSAGSAADRDVVAETVAAQLARIGVEVVPEPVPPADYFAQYVTRGAFDLVSFTWVATSTPLTVAALSVQERDGDELGNNVGQVSTPQLRERFDAALRELDEDRRLALADEIDELLWAQAHSLPLVASPGVYAVRSDVANWGAQGLADPDYLSVGRIG